jgi:predicted transcriptional regulator
MLTMAKLARKGVLTQERTGTKKTDAFAYKANITREKMGRALLEEVAQKVLRKSFPDAVKQIIAKGGK